MSLSFNLIMAQNVDETTRQQKEQELKTVLANKTKTMSDFARFIPYNFPIINRSFYKWMKKGVVFYKERGTSLVPVLPTELDETVKADYEANLSLHPSNDYFEKWKKFFEERCYAQCEGEAVVERYLNKKIDLNTCLAKFKTAGYPDGYTSVMQPLVFNALRQDRNNWYVLYDVYKNMSSVQSKSVIALGAMLCRTSNEVKQWIAVLSIIPKPKKFYEAVSVESYLNDADMLDMNYPLPTASSDEYGGCLSGFIIYTDGTVVMRRTRKNCPTYDNLQKPIEVVESDKVGCKDFLGQGFTFMYLPEGKAYLGHLKREGTGFTSENNKFSAPAIWSDTGRYVPSSRYELALGLEFDRSANVTKEEYLGMTAQQLYARLEELWQQAEEEAADPTNLNNYNPAWVEQGEKIMQKYGVKPWEALVKLEIYIGFPESLLKEYIFYNPEKYGSRIGMHAFKKLATYGNSSTYVYSYALRAILGGKYQRCRIWCRNGKVSAVEYNYYGPF